MNKIEFIKSKFTIRELAERAGANPNKSGKCSKNPLRQEQTCSLHIYDETNSYNDFGGNGGSVIDFYSEYYGLDIPDTIEAMIREAGGFEDDIALTPKVLAPIPAKEYMSPSAVLRAFKTYSDINLHEHKEILLSIAPEYLFNQASEDDLIEFYNLVKFGLNTAVVLLPDYKGISHTFRYRNKLVGDDLKKWVALYGTKSNYAYCRLNQNPITLIVEGSRDFLTALLCGYSVIALPSAGYKLDNELLKDRTCIFIDDDDGKNSMIDLYQNAVCEKVFFNHKAFKEITKCHSKDFSDYLYQFNSIDKFKECFEDCISNMKEVVEIDWKSILNKISSPLNNEDIKNIEDQEFLYPELIIKNNITFIIAAPNTGKSAITFGMIKDLLSSESIDNVFFFDPDSNIGYVKPIISDLSEKYQDKFSYYNGVKTSTLEMKEIMKTMSVLPKGSGKNSLIICDGYQFFLDGGISEDKNHKSFIEITKGIRDRFGATVIILHHTKRSKDEDGNTEYLGSQIVESASDNMLLMQNKKHLEIFVKKSRADKKNNVYTVDIDYRNRVIKSITLKGKKDEIQDEKVEKNSDLNVIDICNFIGNKPTTLKQIKNKFKDVDSNLLKDLLKDNLGIKWNKEVSNNVYDPIYNLIQKEQPEVYSMELPECLL